MIEIYTASVDGTFRSKWGKVVEKTKCIEHSVESRIVKDFKSDANGEYYTIDKYGNKIYASPDEEMDLLKDMPDNYKYDAGPYLKSIKYANEKVLEHPNAIFILDVPKTKANEISRFYGVICQPLEEMSITLLKHKFQNNISQANSIKSWQDCLKTGGGRKLSTVMPANSLIIIDRYLFTGGGRKRMPQDEAIIRKEIEHGIDNIRDILKCLIPCHFKGIFNLLIMFEPKSILERPDWNVPEEKQTYYQHFNDLCNRIAEDLKTMFKKTFPRKRINLELLGVAYLDQSPEYYYETHDRRILSNYYIIRATKAFKAFKNQSVADSQDVFFDALCSVGLTRSTFESHLPYNSHQQVVNAISRHLENSKQYNLPNLLYKEGRWSRYNNLKYLTNPILDNLCK